MTKGGVWLVFKQPRSYMIAKGLISGGEAEKVGTAKAKVSAEVGIHVGAGGGTCGGRLCGSEGGRKERE